MDRLGLHRPFTLQQRRGSGVDKELLAPAGLKAKSPGRIVDLVAKARLRSQAGFILVHAEHQAQWQEHLLWRLLV